MWFICRLVNIRHGSIPKSTLTPHNLAVSHMTPITHSKDIECRAADTLEVRQLAVDFINAFRAHSTPAENIIGELCALALNEANPHVAKCAVRAIFSGIIEPLCDDFSEEGTRLCNKVLVKILDIIRHIPQAGKLNDLLNRCGFHNSDEILCRYEKIIRPRTLPRERQRLIKKVIILSRVTAGADIAITSVMVHRLRKFFPMARLVLIGPSHLATMFPELDNIKTLPFIYKNDGSILEKMASWPPLFEMIQKEINGDKPDSVLFFDPDTRMTQLGLLPVLDDSSTFYFPSRTWKSGGTSRDNLSILTNNWLNIILNETEDETPYLVLHNEGHGYNAFCQKLKNRGSAFIITINFGVGNDSRKKISGFFEEKLLLKLAHEPQTMVILDCGRGHKETQRVQYLLKQARQQGINTATLNEEQIPQADIKFNNGLLIFDGSLDALGKMISAADCFIGYDSCGQHLAAATGSAAVIIFAGAPSERFFEHWSPISTRIKTIIVDSRKSSTADGGKELIAEIQSLLTSIKTNSN